MRSARASTGCRSRSSSSRRASELLPLAQLADLLTARLSFLAGGPRDLPARQQTLRATLDWSYRLLSEEERRLFARLSVFAGGTTLEAAAEVCLEGDQETALGLLESLHDASLLVAQEGGAVMRHTLLETVRQYGADRLQDSADDETGRRHAEWYCVAERAEQELSGDRQTAWFATLDAEHDNLRAALAYLEATGASDLQLRLVVALSRFWYVRAHLGEGRVAGSTTRSLRKPRNHRSSGAER